MSYHIDYLAARRKHINFIGIIRLPILTLLSIYLFFILVKCCWMDGAEYLQTKLFMHGGLFSFSCLNDLTQDFEVCSDALEAFIACMRQLTS